MYNCAGTLYGRVQIGHNYTCKLYVVKIIRANIASSRSCLTILCTFAILKKQHTVSLYFMTFFQQIVQAYFVPEKVLSAKIVPVNVQPEIPIPLYRTVLPSLRAPQPPNLPPVVLWLLPRPPLPLSPVQQPPLPWFQQPLNLVSFYD